MLDILTHDVLGVVDQPTRRRRKQHRSAEPLVVRTDAVVDLLEEWIERHERDHPARESVDRVAYGKGGPLHYSSGRYLCHEADISPRRLSAIRARSTLTIGMGVADDLLCAIGQSAKLGHGDLALYANPDWPKQRVLDELARRGVEIEDEFWEWEVPRS